MTPGAGPVGTMVGPAAPLGGLTGPTASRQALTRWAPIPAEIPNGTNKATPGTAAL